MKLRNLVQNVVDGTSQYNEQQRMQKVRHALRLAVSDAISLVEASCVKEAQLQYASQRGFVGASSSPPNREEVRNAMEERIAERFDVILTTEVHSHVSLENRLKKAELQMDFMQLQLDRREALAAEQRLELLREITAMSEQMANNHDRYNTLLEQNRQLQRRFVLHGSLATAQSQAFTPARAAKRSSSAGATAAAALGNEQSGGIFASRHSIFGGGGSGDRAPSGVFDITQADKEAALESFAELPAQQPTRSTNAGDVHLLSTRMEAEWLALVKEEEFVAKEQHLKYEAEQKLKALQIRLKKEKDVSSFKASKKAEDLLKVETTKLENKLRQLEYQLQIKDAEIESVAQREREKMRSVVQKSAGTTKQRYVRALREMYRQLESAHMRAQDLECSLLAKCQELSDANKLQGHVLKKEKTFTTQELFLQ